MSIRCWKERVRRDVVLVLVFDPFRFVLNKLHFAITRTRTTMRNNLKSTASIAGLMPGMLKITRTCPINFIPVLFQSMGTGFRCKDSTPGYLRPDISYETSQDLMPFQEVSHRRPLSTQRLF